MLTVGMLLKKCHGMGKRKTYKINQTKPRTARILLIIYRINILKTVARYIEELSEREKKCIDIHVIKCKNN